jgi:uncharacterized Zn finger protein (UPF0148 family)
LAFNLSLHDYTIGKDLEDVQEKVNEFEEDTNAKLSEINETLKDLDKLDQLLIDIADLDSDLIAAESDIQSSIEDSDKGDGEDAGFGIAEGLLIVVIVLLVLILLLLLMGRGSGGKASSESSNPKNPGNPGPPVGSKGLESETKEVPKKKPYEPALTNYEGVECLECGTILDKGQMACPNCGAEYEIEEVDQK